MHSSFSCSASNFFHLSCISSWNSASLILEHMAECLGGCGKGCGIPDYLISSFVDPHPLVSGISSTGMISVIVG